MLASNFNNIQNHFLIEELEKLESLDFVSKEQLDTIKKTTVSTKTNSNLLVRFAFFLLGNFVISSALGAVGLFLTMMEGQDAFAFAFLLAGIASFIVAELICKKNFFAYGFDDSFILSITLFLTISVGIYTENVTAILLTFIACNVFCTIRYVHVASAFFAIFGLVGLIGYAIIADHILPSYYLPIVVFLIAVGLYFLQHLLAKSVQNFIYANVFQLVKIMSLLLAYASLNYFVVLEMSELLLDMNMMSTDYLPFSSLFYFATFGIPILYIFVGLKKRDRTFFWMGLLAFAAGYATIRNYYYIVEPEIELMAVGLLLFGIVYFCINKLKNKADGITFKEDKSLNPMAFDVVKAILINANVNVNSPTSEQSPMEFGGGGFSGGGSGGDF
ncbi:hypothetical protein FLAN108750_13795 [Flavobacterium antarcticum]|uniref:hypothetical protein n=1 Tax=Flavobacterium antarcticum TaxID=271155 RepID=UPI0003B5E892|nr:hypothetical protein [Flavobacterium antarcticum]